jgi:hypothetical protein
MRRSTLYRQTSRHHAVFFIVGICIVITAGSEMYVSHLEHDAIGLAMWLLLAVSLAYVAFRQLKLCLHYADRARMAESAEWRYHHNQSRTLRGFVRRNQTKH